MIDIIDYWAAVPDRNANFGILAGLPALYTKYLFAYRAE